MHADDDDPEHFTDIEQPPDAEPGKFTATQDEELDQYAQPTPVDSSWILSAYYDKTTQTLYMVTQSGRDYTLFGVPPDTFLEFMKSPSPGQFFNSELKGKY